MRKIIKGLQLIFLNLKISKKLVLCYLFTILIPLTFLFSLFLVRIDSAFQTEYASEKRQTLQQTAEAFRSVESQVAGFVYELESNKELIIYMIGGYRSASAEVYALLRNIEPVFRRFVATNKLVYLVEIYRYKSSYISHTKYIQPIENSLYDQDVMASLKGGERMIQVKQQEERVLLDIVAPIFRDGGLYNVGICHIVMDITDIWENIPVLSGESFVLRSPYGYLIRQLGDRNTKRINEQEFEKMSGDRISEEITELKLQLYMINNKGYYRQKEIVTSIILFLLALCFLSVVYFLMLSMLVRPILQLARVMERTGENGGALPQNIVYGKDEVGELVESVGRMVKRNEQLSEEVLRAIMEQQRLKYYALYSQIKPHFIFNLLQRINMLVFMDQKKDTNHLLSKFGDFLRYSMKNDQDFVTLKMEIQHTRNYMEIVKDNERFTFSEEIAPNLDTNAILCPQFILQPIVENAIKYNAPNGVNLCLRISQEAERILVTVSDDGIGISPEAMKTLEDRLAGSSARIFPKENSPTGIGLANVNTRLKYFYGQDCGLIAENMPDHGVRVTLTLKQYPLKDFRRNFYEDIDSR